MKKTTKNIISISLIILTTISIFITMNYAKNHIESTNNTSGFPDNMPKTEENTNSDTNTPPQKPEENSQENGNQTNDDQSNMETPPQKPEENSQENEPQSNDQNHKPDNMPDMPNTNKKLTKIYYIAFALESLIISYLIMHLIMTNLNKKTIKETYQNKDKIIITILGTIILIAILTYSSAIVTTKYFLEDDNQKSHDIQNNQNITYQAVTKIDKDTTIQDATYTSQNEDENAILIESAEATISNTTINKEGDSDGGDTTSFYGTNSAILAKSGAQLTLKNLTITTNATGANGVFSYGGSATTENKTSDGTTITISDSKITTTKDNSGGIMTTGGGIMKANNLDITTSGISSAAIRSDRGGGTVEVTGGTYTTNGQGSPAIYSTANITVTDAELTSNTAEGIVVEGNNSVILNNCILTDTNNKLNGQSTTYKNIFLYQSMSGDAADGNSTFTSKDSQIITNVGDTFYITNTTSIINLTNNIITDNDKSGSFLRAQSDSWGKSGSNGGKVTLNMTNQKASGNIIIDSNSTIDINLKTNSYLETTINTTNQAKTINLTLDKTSKIKLTGDSYINSLTNDDQTNANIDFNGYKLYVNNKAIN